MAQGKAATSRKAITLAVATWRHLEVLATKGIHGTDVTGVAASLIEEGVRNAVRDGFLELQTVEPESPTPASKGRARRGASQRA